MANKQTKSLLSLGLVAVFAVGTIWFVWIGPRDGDRRQQKATRNLEPFKGKKDRQRKLPTAGLDSRFAPILAMAKAPPGSTPCETAYNGYLAFAEAPDPKKMPRRWGTLPSRDVFLERCVRLSVEEQLCLQWKYGTENADRCRVLADRLFQPGVVFDGSSPYPEPD